MRSLKLLVLTTSAAATATSVAAQQPERARVESRARAEARANQVRDTIRARGVSLEAEIERLAAELLTAARRQSQASQEIRALTTRAMEEANRRETELSVRRLQTQIDVAARQSQLLRGRLAALCDRGAKPQGYMGITFSAEMSAAESPAGTEVFRFEENPTVESVEPGSPAEMAGVRKGDEIILIGGRNLAGRAIEFTSLLRPNSRLPMRIRRDGDARDVILFIKERPPALDSGCPFLDARVTAAFGEPLPPLMLPPRGGAIVRAMPAQAPAAATGPITGRVRIVQPRAAVGEGGAVAAAAPNARMAPSVTLIAPNAPEAPSEARSVFIVGPGANQMVIAGATIVRPNADLRETFGVKSGVLVLDVARGSPAYTSGLKGGDIILSAGRFAATSPVVIQRAMQSADERHVELRIVRKQKPQTLLLRW